MADVDLQQIENNWFTDQPPPQAPVVNQPIDTPGVDLKGVESSWFNPTVAENPAPTQLPPPPTKGAMEGTFIGQVAKYLTAPGNAYKSTNPISTGEMVEPAGGLAGLIATGSMPSVVRAGESSLPFINNLAKNLRPQPKPLIDPASANLAALAIDKYGIPLHGGQISENRTVNLLDNMLNYSKYGEQKLAFNRAVARTFGQDADKLTPDVMLKAQKELGANFDTVAANTTVKMDSGLINGLQKINEDAKFLQENERNVITKHINHIIDIAAKNGGEISGSMLQDLVAHNSPLGRATRDQNSNIRQLASSIKNEVIDSMGRYAPPEMKQLYTNTKYQWKNLKTVEDLAEKAPTGDVSPPLLMGAVRKSYNDMAYGGGGDLADLARIGQRFLKEPAQSNTQPRQKAESLMRLGGLGAAGIEAGLAYHDPMMALKAGAVAATAAAGTKLTKAATAKLLRSDAYTNRLINSAIPERSGSVNTLQKLVNGGYLPPVAMAPLYPIAAAPTIPLLQSP